MGICSFGSHRIRYWYAVIGAHGLVHSTMFALPYATTYYHSRIGHLYWADESATDNDLKVGCPHTELVGFYETFKWYKYSVTFTVRPGHMRRLFVFFQKIKIN
jgi:hypothetical protein